MKAYLSAEDYMIDQNYILLDPDYIFVNVSTYETSVVCLPIDEEDTGNSNLKDFFRNFVFNLNFDQTENGDYIAKLIHYLNGNSFSVEEFNSVIENIDQSGAADISANPPAAQPQPQFQMNMSAASSENKNSYAQNVPETQPDSAPVPDNYQKMNSQPDQQIVYAQQSVPQKNNRQLTGIQKPPAQQTSFNVPPARPTENNTAVQNSFAPAPAVQTPGGEKEISLFYLLQHYNSENAAAYKAQKAAKKAKKKQGNAALSPPQNAFDTANNSGFVVPGADRLHQGNSGFNVPGKSNSQQGNSGFDVPGKSKPQQGNALFSNPGYDQPQFHSNTNQSQIAYQEQKRGLDQVSSAELSFQQPAPTTVLKPVTYGETTVLNDESQNVPVVTPYLYRIKNNESIPINKPLYRIGKERSFVDYFIGDNSAISRSHANILIKNGKFYIIDTNSTNHTYLNGQMIQSSTEVEINNGDKIRLANEDFEFKVY